LCSFAAQNNSQMFATLLERCQDEELIQEMFHSDLDNLAMFSSAKILRSQTNIFICPKEAVLPQKEDYCDWKAILGNMSFSSTILPFT
jgi:hypothetical protein